MPAIFGEIQYWLKRLKMSSIKSKLTYKTKENIVCPSNNNHSLKYNQNDAIREFEELKQIALNCFDKNGNPNISAALRAVENKAKIANLYSQSNLEIGTVVKMGEITIDGQQLKLNIGEDFNYQ